MWKPKQSVYTKFGDFMTLNPVRNPAFFSENHQFVAACVPKAGGLEQSRGAQHRCVANDE